MESMTKERCIYCGGDVYYHLGEKLIKCEWCGHSLVTSEFENELARIQNIEEENELIKEKLTAAEKEKQAANDRLFAALSSLGKIQNDQDVLGKMLSTLTGGQQDALQSLQFLKGISERLVNSQNDIFARMGVMNDIGEQLQKIDMEEQERQSVMNEFIQWSQQTREEDLQRLQMIVSSTDELLEGQKRINSKVDTLKAEADQLQKSIDAFHAEYTKDKLEELRQLYHQAANFQHDREFDKAEKYYHRVLTKGGDDAEVYWRLLMCHYCLFYQKDDEGHLIPIILNPDLTDPAEMSLRRELDRHMTEQERPYYQSELEKIDRILDKYRLLKDEVQYDVFISVRHNLDGHYTSDSDVASDLYDFLTEKGLRVFNSRRTTIPAGQEYEPYIISALMSSKVLIVVGSTPENMNSPWVKNEWSRFQWLQYHEKEQTGRTERVLFCYLAKGMQAKHIPKALNPNRQAIRDGVGAHDKLLKTLAFLIREENDKIDIITIKNKLKYWLIQERFDDVKRECIELADSGNCLTCAWLHLYALCAEKHVTEIMQVVNSATILDSTKEFKAALALCIEEKTMLQDLLAKNIEWRNKHGNKQSPESIEEWFHLAKNALDNKNYTEAIKWCSKAAKAGHAESQYLLGLSFLEGWDAPVDEKQGVVWIRKAAEAGFIEAAFELGECYNFGKGVRKNKNEADKWYKKAVDVFKNIADSGSIEAQTTLALCYKHGLGVTKDLAEMAKYYKTAAEQGDAFSQHTYADCLANGEGVERNIEEALEWYQKAVDQGNEDAKKKLDELKKTIEEEVAKSDNESAEDWLKQGKEAEEKKEYTEAIKWYRHAATQGLAEAQYRLGLCYENGNGIRKNRKTAASWYQKAAEQGNENAKKNLKELELSEKGSADDWYRLGKEAEENHNDVETEKWYRKAAEAGHVESQYALAQYYYNYNRNHDNNKFRSDFLTESFPWFKMAANQGHAESCYHIGYRFEHGLGVPMNEKEAAKWYQKAAEQGNENAKNNPIFLSKYGSSDDWYRLGKEAEEKKDYTEAVKWYRKAADADHADAQMALAFCYKDGLGVPRKNSKLFSDWAIKGIDKCSDPILKNRYADYLFKLGCKYEDEFKGRLTLHDRKIAKIYYQQAANLGHKEAKQKLNRLFW